MITLDNFERKISKSIVLRGRGLFEAGRVKRGEEPEPGHGILWYLVVRNMRCHCILMMMN